MKNHLKVGKMIPAIALSILVSVPALAGQRTTNPELVYKSAETQSKHDWQQKEFRRACSGSKLLLLMHLSRVLDQLKSGSVVDPEDIATLYREHYRDVPGQVD